MKKGPRLDLRPMRQKSLAELEGVIAGEPLYDSYLVRKIYAPRKKPVGEFTTEDLRITIGQGLGLQYLLPLLVARLRASLQFCRRAFALVTDSSLTEKVALGPSAGDSVLRVRAVLFFTTDLAEHYSQLASYMRLLGMVPPSALRRTDH